MQRHRVLWGYQEEREKKRTSQWPRCWGLAHYSEGARPADPGPKTSRWTVGERDGQPHATEHRNTQVKHLGMAKEEQL